MQQQQSEGMIVADLRSDTVTKPCTAMREAIAAAEVGDDVMGDDPTVIKLEKMTADLLGKEAGLFVPSGTMGNLLCVMSHCWGRGLEVLLGDQSHTFIYEQGNIAQFGGVHSRTLTNLSDGTFSIAELRDKVRTDDFHYPKTSLVCVENTHNKCGGKVIHLKWLKELWSVCAELGLPSHCDGARLFNAAAFLNVSVAELVSGFDSVSICLSKGLGAPIGSVIVGTKDFIDRARRLRKGLGGGMRQSGVLAAAGIFGLQHNVSKLPLDHARALELAKVIADNGGDLFEVEDLTNNSNLIFVTIHHDTLTAKDIVQRLKQVTESEKSQLGFSATVMCGDSAAKRMRLATHLGFTDVMLEATKKKLQFVLREFLQQLKK